MKIYADDLNTKSLVADIQPGVRNFINPLEQQPKVNIWIGEANVTASLHMDTYENFFVQLNGKKRFYLFNPNQYQHVKLHPFLHPSYAQSQLMLNTILLEEEDNQVNNNNNKLTGIEAILNSGDVLYIPPLYFHHVTSLTTSISVNIWSIGNEQKIYDKIIQIIIKLLGNYNFLNRYQNRNLVQYIILQLTNKEFIHQLVDIRYITLINNKEIILATSKDNFICNDVNFNINDSLHSNFLISLHQAIKDIKLLINNSWLSNA